MRGVIAADIEIAAEEQIWLQLGKDKRTKTEHDRDARPFAEFVYDLVGARNPARSIAVESRRSDLDVAVEGGRLHFGDPTEAPALSRGKGLARALPTLVPSVPFTARGRWRSLVAHLHDTQGVTGSSPVRPTRLSWEE